MTDYELYLVKKAYHKKIAKGVTILGQPVMYDPYEVYNQRKKAIIDAIAKPKFLHDNARREQEAAVRRAKRNNYISGAVSGTLGGLGGAALYNYISGKNNLLGYGGSTLAGIGIGLAGGGIKNYMSDFKKEKGEGWAKGDALDRAAFQEAQRKYDEEVARATREFNLKYTGMEDPDKDAIYKGGIKLHDEK